MFRLLFAAAIVGALLPSPPEASAGTITFESLADLSEVGSQIAGVTFTNATVLVSEFSLGEDEFPPRSGEKVAADIGGAMSVGFAAPVSFFQAYFTYLVPVTIEAFDPFGASLGTATSSFSTNLGLSGDPGSAPNELLALNFSNIASVTLTGDPLGDSFAVDDISFVTAVPEPSTLALTAIGLAALLRPRFFRRRCG
jgi:hypothetical protein